jgi:hypothetical protein
MTTHEATMKPPVVLFRPREGYPMNYISYGAKQFLEAHDLSIADVVVAAVDTAGPGEHEGWLYESSFDAGKLWLVLNGREWTILLPEEY